MLAVSHLTKRFGEQEVVRDVSFKVARGECVAFIGENGAGKSTLAKCLAGVHLPDSGQIAIEGTAVRLHSPRTARQLGVAFLPQELAYASSLSVAENIVLGQWPARWGITTRSAVRARARQALSRMDVDLALDRPMSSLTLGARQLVEIAKALLRDARLLVLDEPTAALGEAESARLFATVSRVAAGGTTVVFISHRMDEVHRFSRTVHVMRNGALVASVDPKTSTKAELVSHMLGTAANEPRSTERVVGSDRIAMRVTNFHDPGPPAVLGARFSLHEGEVLGLFGVRGSGADVIAESLGGKNKASQATAVVHLRDRSGPLFGSPLAAKRAGIAYVPQERKRDGLVLGLSVKANISLTVLSSIARFGIRRVSAENSLARRLATDLDLRYRSVAQTVGQLSGGNQQKVLLASRLATRPKILILHEPTRGVDVGARLQIHRELQRLAADGTSCLVVSSDVEEITNVCSRALIIRDGMILKELRQPLLTQQAALHWATHGDDGAT
jgi:ABC-type sugar transport system ATPase subunit